MPEANISDFCSFWLNEGFTTFMHLHALTNAGSKTEAQKDRALGELETFNFGENFDIGNL